MYHHTWFTGAGHETQGSVHAAQQLGNCSNPLLFTSSVPPSGPLDLQNGALGFEELWELTYSEQTVCLVSNPLQILPPLAAAYNGSFSPAQ